ncbi:MAG: chlorite dismutase family protein [Nitrososphaeraceae archaeon]|nr:chlorite dismutase family protein [Nitrososphaeraceae archaeon]
MSSTERVQGTMNRPTMEETSLESRNGATTTPNTTTKSTSNTPADARVTIPSSSTISDRASAPQTSPVFLNFSFYKVDPKWRWLNDLGKEEAAKEFSSLIEVAKTKMKVRVYSTLGLRDDSEFMLWMISESVEKMQVLASKIYLTIFGKYIESSRVYLSSYRPSIYSKKTKMTPGYLLDDSKKENEPMKYAIVYPFIKSREWYLLPLEDRIKMMDEHITIGRRFPQVRLNTSYSFGLGDQDFMLAFETTDLMAFQDLIVKLRETRVSRYVVKDTPMIVCIYKGGVEEFIKSLG